MSAATREEWERSVADTLSRGRPSPLSVDEALARLTTTTEDGLSVHPLYDPHDAVDLALIGEPGAAPFVRGRTAGARTDGWDIRQQVATSTDGSALDEVSRGATSVWVPGRDRDVDELDRILAGVHLEMAGAVVDGGPAAAALVDLWERRGTSAPDRRGSLGLDPVTDQVLDRVGAETEDARADLAELAGRRGESPAAVITVDGPAYAAAGATIAEQLGCVLAAGVESLRLLEQTGLDPADAFGAVELRLAVSADQFTTIAAIRALRRAWSRVAEVAGDAGWAGATPVHAVTDPMVLTRFDPWVNALRTTIGCFAAAAAGADAVTVMPSDVHSGREPTELTRRVARNTQLILHHESHLSEVVDPAGGSFYVESLTGDLAEAAWRWLQRLEAGGGIVAAKDELASAFEDARAERARRIATRQQPVTGVTEFPDPSEQRAGAAGDDRRHSAAIEALRERAGRDGPPEPVHLAVIGSLARAGARLTFAQNFFGVAGLTTIAGPPSEDPAAIADGASEADVICICGTDDDYARLGADVVTALRAVRPDARIVLAGSPKHGLDEMRAAGLDGTIALGANLIDELTPILERSQPR